MEDQGVNTEKLKDAYIVWGKLHGGEALVKLHGAKTRRKAEIWMEKNRKFYDDMRIYKGYGVSI